MSENTDDIRLFANVKPVVSVPSQLDAYSVNGTANGIVNLFAEVAANLQVKYGVTGNARSEEHTSELQSH